MSLTRIYVIFKELSIPARNCYRSAKSWIRGVRVKISNTINNRGYVEPQAPSNSWNLPIRLPLLSDSQARGNPSDRAFPPDLELAVHPSQRHDLLEMGTNADQNERPANPPEAHTNSRRYQDFIESGPGAFAARLLRSMIANPPHLGERNSIRPDYQVDIGEHMQ